MKRAILAFAAIAGFLLSAAPADADFVIGRDELRSGEISPSGRLFELLLESELAREQLKIQNERRAGLKNRRFKRVIKGIAVREVILGVGNNPLNQRQPLNNTTLANGQSVLVAQDDLNNQGGGNAGGGNVGGQDPANLNACIGQQVVARQSPTAPPDLLFVSIRIDPATLVCTAAGGASADGDFLIFQFALNLGLADFVSIFADALQPDWIVISPPGGANVNLAGNRRQTLIFDVRAADNSVTIRATVEVQGRGFNTTNIIIQNLEATF